LELKVIQLFVVDAFDLENHIAKPFA